MSRALFSAAVATCAAVTFAFLLLPLAAIFLRVPVRDLVDQLGNDAFRDALVVSLKTSAIAHAAVLVFGTPTAYLLARNRFPGRSLVVTLTELPLVLPPAVAGIGLLVAFGRFGLLGDELNALGIPHTVIVGPDGKIAWVNTGYQPGVEKEAAFATGFLFFVVTIVLAIPGAVIIAVENVRRGLPRRRSAEPGALRVLASEPPDDPARERQR